MNVREFASTYVSYAPNRDRWLDDLTDAVAAERVDAADVERRRLTTDPAYFAHAYEITRDEIAAHGSVVPEAQVETQALEDRAALPAPSSSVPRTTASGAANAPGRGGRAFPTRDEIRTALAVCGGNRMRTARALGISVQTVRKVANRSAEVAR